MANSEHVAQLMKGVDAWNLWRNQHPNIQPDLAKAELQSRITDAGTLEFADLSGADLRWAYLSGAQLSRAILARANLVAADLRDADLSLADLSNARCGAANLIRAKLVSADFSGADLREARLNEADLSLANLFRADLRGADLSLTKIGMARLQETQFDSAIFNFTTLTNLDLRQARGLQTAVHNGPSSIAVDTVFRSGGNVPEVFLKGAGVPDDFITYMRSLTSKPIESYSCFISYSSKDQQFRDYIYHDLSAKGVCCWSAPEDLKIGDWFQDEIERGIQSHDKLLVVLSKASVESRWVEREVNAAREREERENRTILFPIRIDDAIITATQPWAADIRRTRHIGNFSLWEDRSSYQKAFDRLTRDLRAEAARIADAPSAD